MPSKGNPIVRFRLDPEQLALLRASVDRCNRNRPRAKQYTLSSWCRRAVLERLHKLARSSRRATPQPEGVPEE
jgi:hypothetical protein